MSHLSPVASRSHLSGQAGFSRRTIKTPNILPPPKQRDVELSRAPVSGEPCQLQKLPVLAPQNDAAQVLVPPNAAAEQNYPRWPLFGILAALTLNLAYVVLLGWLAFKLVAWLLS